MRKIGIVCLPGLESFLGDVVDFLKKDNEVKTCFTADNKELKEIVEWAETVWVEWGNELAVALTQADMLQGKHAICRVHSYEALSGHAAAIDWNKFDDVIFVAVHIRDLIFQQISVSPKVITKDFNTHIIPNGIDVDKYKFSHRGKGENIAFLGNLSAKKGPMLLIHAFYELLKATGNDYKLWIAGTIQDPRFGLYLNHMIEELDLHEKLFFSGYVENVEKWLEDKNYIVCSSPLESQGLGIMEAMCLGIKPLIHNFVGAKNIYDEKYLWTSIQDFIDMVEGEEYESLEYRGFISKHFLLRHRMKDIKKIVDNPPEKKPVQSIPSEQEYTEFNYWNRRPYPTDPNMSAETVEMHIDYIEKQVFQAKSVLDFGPGIGRTFKAYKDISYVEGCDISRMYEFQVKAEAEKLGLDFKLIHLDLVELGHLPYTRNTFDVAVAAEVLLHQRPENILLVMRELARVAKKVVIISWGEDRVSYSTPGEKSSGPNHCFHYNYLQICKEEGWKVTNFVGADRQVYFVYGKKREIIK